jgi:hypothetical protein
MTRKHYERIAANIRDLDLARYGTQEYQQRRYIAGAIAAALDGTNPYFDRGRFIAAAVATKGQNP